MSNTPELTYIGRALKMMLHCKGNTPELTYIGEWVNPDIWDGDSIHQVYTGLKGGAELHRFVNKGGVPYSAIYLNGIECCNHERRKEAGLINYWETNAWEFWVKRARSTH